MVIVGRRGRPLLGGPIECLRLNRLDVAIGDAQYFRVHQVKYEQRNVERPDADGEAVRQGLHGETARFIAEILDPAVGRIPARVDGHEGDECREDPYHGEHGDGGASGDDGPVEQGPCDGIIPVDRHLPVENSNIHQIPSGFFETLSRNGGWKNVSHASKFDRLPIFIITNLYKFDTALFLPKM